MVYLSKGICPNSNPDLNPPRFPPAAGQTMYVWDRNTGELVQVLEAEPYLYPFVYISEAEPYHYHFLYVSEAEPCLYPFLYP